MTAVTARDLPELLATLPEAWAQVLPGWTSALQQDLIGRIQAASFDRPLAPSDPFRALRLTGPDQVRVVVLGQDPYPGPGHADGLAFSAGRGRPASLRRIFAVLSSDRPGFTPPPGGQLDAWARQGVLLLNPVLTVEVGRIGSHLHCGWQALTSQIVQFLCHREDPPVFLLWGSKAQAFFDEARPPGRQPPVLRTRHPSNDFRREFMAEGSHFVATAHQVNWWAL
jgi:uracil-DNA glycosylase